MLMGKVTIEAGTARGGGRIGAGAETGGAEASLEGPGGAKEVEACLIGPRGTEGAGLTANVDIKAEGGARAEGTKECLEGAEGARLTAKEDIKAEGGGGA